MKTKPETKSERFGYKVVLEGSTEAEKDAGIFYSAYISGLSRVHYGVNEKSEPTRKGTKLFAFKLLRDARLYADNEDRGGLRVFKCKCTGATEDGFLKHDVGDYDLHMFFTGQIKMCTAYTKSIRGSKGPSLLCESITLLKEVK